MGVFKEEVYAFESIEKKQRRIYNDATDYGYPFDTKNMPQDVKNVFDIINNLKAMDKQFSEEEPMVRNRQEWGKGTSKGVSVDVVIFWEQDGGYYNVTKYTITFQKLPPHPEKIRKDCDGVISVYAEQYKEKV
jgi:hypothetical protein